MAGRSLFERAGAHEGGEEEEKGEEEKKVATVAGRRGLKALGEGGILSESACTLHDEYGGGGAWQRCDPVGLW